MSGSESWINPAIGAAREAALSLLSPSRVDLEHGAELHGSATVVDAYGFACFAADDITGLSQEYSLNPDPWLYERSVARSCLTRMVEDPGQLAMFAEVWRAAGVTCVVKNSGQESNRLDQLIERLAHNTFVMDSLPQILSGATTGEDVAQVKLECKHCYLMTTNGVPLTGAGRSVADELRQVLLLYQLGVRMMHLTYNRRNLIGDGCAETTDGGLSDFGRSVIAEMNRIGVIIDLAHSSARTCLEAAACTTAPVVASHTACAALNPHYRAKHDEVLHTIADTGGFVGICCIPAFLGGSGDINALLDHIDHAIRVIGEDHVAIGTDVGFTLPAVTTDTKPPAPPVPPPAFESFWRPGEALFLEQWNQPHMIQSLGWTNWPLFTAGLIKRGYTDSQVTKLIGGNVLRVLSDVGRVAATQGIKPNCHPTQHK